VTDWNKTEENAKRRAEREWALTFDAIRDPICILENDWTIRRMNRDMARRLGLAPDQAVGRKCYELVHQTDEAPDYCPHRKVMEDGLEHSIESEIEFLGGVFEITVSPLLDEQGRVMGSVHVAHDVTQSRRNQRRLAESEHRFRTFVEDANDIVFALNAEGVFTYVSPNWLDFMGAPAETALGRSFEPYVHPEDVHICRDILNRVISTGEKQKTIHYRTRRADGAWRWHTSTGSPLFDENHRIIGFFGIARDVTEQKEREQALEMSEARYRSLTRNFPNGALFLFDRDYRYLIADGKAFQPAGLSSASVVGKTVREVFPELWEEIEPHHRAVFQGRETYYEVEYRGRVYSNQLLPVADAKGRIAQGIAVVQDITDQLKLKREKEDVERQYRQAQKMEALGTLAGGVAHDFNNLLQTIGGYAQLLLDRDPGPEDRKSLQAIEEAKDRAARLVRHLLLFGRKAEMEKKPVDINREITQTRTILERTLPKMVAIDLKLDPNLAPVMADPVQIEVMLLNLASNAADAMPDGGRLVIETANAPPSESGLPDLLNAPAESYVTLSVSDTGHGIDPAIQEHIFEPFFTTKEAGQGTGLGLASVYGIVESHGGSIVCRSETGRGTTFRTHLPAAGAPVPSAVEDGRLTSAGGDETILIVDDEKPIRDMAALVLARFGYRTLTAASGEEALERYAAEGDRIDLVVLDIGMPGMGGRQCLAELLRINPEAKTLIASGYAGEERHAEMAAAGASGYIAKPYNISDLAAEVRRTLDR
jgi:PAS domain S-box-containing protein